MPLTDTAPGRRVLYVATAAVVVGYGLFVVVLLAVLTLLRPGSDAAGGVLVLGEGLAGILGFVAAVLAIVAMVARSRAGAGFSAHALVVLLAGLGLSALAPLVSLGYIVASTPFV